MKPAPSPAAERQRRHRERVRRGVEMVVPVEVTGADLDSLIDGSLLEAWDGNKPEKVGEAIRAALNWADLR